MMANVSVIVSEKDKELGAAQAEIKALRTTEVSKDKAIEELNNALDKLDKKLTLSESFVEYKNLEIKKLTSEKKDALAAQYAAEATLRRVHASQKNDDSLPVDSLIAPLEAEIKRYKNEIAALQEDKKALERLTKSKESALLEAERILRSALERALIVEEVQNQNYELKRQIEICQEENRILEKSNRQKVLEVGKLSQAILELQENVLAGGTAANSIRDYKRQISDLNEEKRKLERELARVKVCANRVATVVANEWKDENEKVMPVKEWLEERRLLQVELQRLKDKLAISERTAKAEAGLKEKLKRRLNILEEGLKHASIFSINSEPFRGSPKPEATSNILGFLPSNGGVQQRSASQPKGSAINPTTLLQQPKIENEKANAAAEQERAGGFRKKFSFEENKSRNNPWVSRSKVTDFSGKENTDVMANKHLNLDKYNDDNSILSAQVKNKSSGNEKHNRESTNSECEDMVSGFLYDRLQKEVLNLTKSCKAKDNCLNAKDQEIQMLMKKVDTLTKAIEVESKKTKRETASKVKEPASTKVDTTAKIGSTKSSTRSLKQS